MKKLIVNADDFGMTEGVNRGIIDCHQRGVVTSTTLMVNGEAVAGAAALAAENPGLGVGLHINLTAGPPTRPPESVRSLVGRDGCFPGKGNMIFRLTTGAIDRDQLASELTAQIQACRALGVTPTHVDSHHHIHAHPVMASALARICPPLGIQRMRGYRLAPRSLKALGIRAAAMLSVASAMRVPDRFAGIEEMGSRDMVAAFERELACEGGTLEFMCHPGYLDERLQRLSTYNDLRQAETEALVSPDLRRVVEKSGVRLIDFRGL